MMTNYHHYTKAEEHAQRDEGIFKRTLGRSGIEVIALGIGGWTIGGPRFDEEMASRLDGAKWMTVFHCREP